MLSHGKIAGDRKAQGDSIWVDSPLVKAARSGDLVESNGCEKWGGIEHHMFNHCIRTI